MKNTSTPRPARRALLIASALTVPLPASAQLILNHQVEGLTSTQNGSHVTYSVTAVNAGDTDLGSVWLRPGGAAYLNPTGDNSLVLGNLAAGATVAAQWTVDVLAPRDLATPGIIPFTAHAYDGDGNARVFPASSTEVEPQ